MWSRDFSGSSVVKTLRFHAGGAGSIPGRVTKIPHATWCGQKKLYILNIYIYAVTENPERTFWPTQ